MKLEKSHLLLPLILCFILLVVVLLSVRVGAVYISLEDIIASFTHWFDDNHQMALNERIFLTIRLPRAMLCIFVGASLAVGGSMLQALFRNPIVEPGLIGISSGAAFGAALFFVLGATFSLQLGAWALPIASCAGAVLATSMVFTLSFSNSNSKNSIVTLLLVGIAVNALFFSGVGFLSYIARDPQARSITFWGMGTLSGANWDSVRIVGLSTILCCIFSLKFAKQLNALMMGEDEAMLLGVNIQRLQWMVLTINVVMIATATAFVGVISFVGLIVPHLIRLLIGSDNRNLIYNCAIAGAIFLCLADLIARIAVRPAELPIGIVTSFVGVPIFIYLLRSKNNLL